MALRKVYCFPFAGAGASFYRVLPPVTPGGIAIAGMQLPGREERFEDEPYAGINDAADELAAEIAQQATGDGYALFGHSFGAVLAFEVARRLAGSALERLIVAGSVAPGTDLGRRSGDLTDAQFIERVEQIAGYVHPALEEPELQELLLPVLRADVAMHESYAPADDEPLAIPITVLRGANDTAVSAADCAGWRRWTTRECAYVEVAGGHMFVAEDPPALLKIFDDVAAAPVVSGP